MLLGIDIGTRNIKCGLFDDAGHSLRVESTRTPWSAPGGSLALSGAALFAAVRDLVDRTASEATEEIVAVGIASLAETGFIVDSAGDPMAPAIAWQDERGHAEGHALADCFGDDFAAVTGRAPSALPTIAKLKWMSSHGVLPSGRWLGIAEWVGHRLGGAAVAEPSLASRTGLFDIRTCQPWHEGIKWCGATAEVLPEIRPATDGIGIAADAIEVIEGATLAVAGHDHLAAAIGVGATNPADVLDSCGTAEAIVMTSALETVYRAAHITESGGTVSLHVLPGYAAAFASSYRSGAALSAVLRDIGVDESDPVALDSIDAEALEWIGSREPSAIGGLPDGPVVWPGDLLDASRAERWAAVLGYIGRLGETRLAELETTVGPATRVLVSGGWATGVAVRTVKQQMADVVRFPVEAEAGTRGAALVAALAAGVYESPAALPDRENELRETK